MTSKYVASQFLRYYRDNKQQNPQFQYLEWLKEEILTLGSLKTFFGKF